MNLYGKNLILVFIACLFASLFVPAIFPWMRLLFFVPFMVILFYQKPLVTCLWGALVCGLIVDLFSPYDRLGIHALAYCLATCLLYQHKRHFFADTLSTLPIMTYFFSMIATLIQVILVTFIERVNPITWGWFATDILIFPLCDAIYAFSIFVLPGLLLGKKIRKGKDYFQNSQNEV